MMFFESVLQSGDIPWTRTRSDANTTIPDGVGERRTAVIGDDGEFDPVS